jgi:hypothetical protein
MGDSLIDPDSPHGRLARPSILNLPPPHSADSVFVDNETGALYKQVYSGNCSLVFKHFFESPKEICLGYPNYHLTVCVCEDNGLLGSLAFVEYKAEVTAEVIGVQTIYRLSDGPLLGMSGDQLSSLGSRALHLLFRLAGYDLGIRSMVYLGQMGCCQKVGWWKEAVDLAVI